jgi:hypothetical protein
MRHARFYIFGSLTLDVESDLLIQFAIYRSAAENGAEAVEQVAQHEPSSLMSNTCAMARASLRQAPASVSSCLRPLRVSS